MAGNTLQWTFKLFDRISSPAKAIGSALGGVHKGLLKVKETINVVDHAMGILQKGAQAFGHLKELFAHAIEHMAFKQDSLIALTAMMGTRDAAKEMFEWVEGFAGKTGTSVETLMGRTKELLTAGFKSADIKILSQAISDLSVIDPGKAEAFTFALAQTQRMGFATARSMLALRSSGLQMQPIYERMAKLYGTNVEGLKKLIAQGKVSAGALTFAATKQVQEQFSGGKVGSVIGQKASSLPGVVARLKMLPELFASAVFGLEAEGTNALARAFEKILAYFDPSGPSGKRIVDGIHEIFGKVAAFLEHVDWDKVTKSIFGLFDLLGSAATVILPLVPAIVSVVAGMKIFSAAMAVVNLVMMASPITWIILGIVAALTALVLAFLYWDKIAAFFKGVWTTITTWLSEIWTKLVDAGANLIDGLIEGIKSRIFAAVDAVKGVGEAVVGGLKSMLGIHSPSAVFEGLGRFSAEGFSKGLANGIAGVEGATVRVAGAATSGAASGSARGRGGHQITVNVSVNAPGAPAEIAKQIADLTVQQLGNALEQLALESGMA